MDKKYKHTPSSTLPPCFSLIPRTYQDPASLPQAKLHALSLERHHPFIQAVPIII